MTTKFHRSQEIFLPAFDDNPSTPEEERLHNLDGNKKGSKVMKNTLSCWIRDAINIGINEEWNQMQSQEEDLGITEQEKVRKKICIITLFLALQPAKPIPLKYSFGGKKYLIPCLNFIRTLLNQLGTSEDSSKLQQNLFSTPLNVLAKETNTYLKNLSFVPTPLSPTEQRQQKLQKERLMNDFSAALNHFPSYPETSVRKGEGDGSTCPSRGDERQKEEPLVSFDKSAVSSDCSVCCNTKYRLQSPLLAADTHPDPRFPAAASPWQLLL
ncbi:unnamed protein product [Ranitomeya imitator]|uniref:Syntaxin N-terminal domain-containing protein n=1 Tax=Ranitomeya imitator TaxID=111125 RepID=A0ABN9MDK0_9NEOB|nr:unnamed protein product [Ranitomeya imitator]